MTPFGPGSTSCNVAHYDGLGNPIPCPDAVAARQPVPAARIHAAWQEAQEAFHLMLDANVYGDPAAPETRAYVTAERHLDMLLADAQFAEVQAQLDAALSAGDHYIYPAGVGK